LYTFHWVFWFNPEQAKYFKWNCPSYESGQNHFLEGKIQNISKSLPFREIISFMFDKNNK
jgi:hypothetical protein